MNADRLIAMANNPRNIAGIFNYCDRWCERCLFTERCLQYQTCEPVPPANNEEEAKRLLLEHVEAQFTLTCELLTRKMAEFGIPMPSADELTIADDEEQRREERVRGHALVRAGHAYASLVGEWFVAERTALVARANVLVERAERGEDGDALMIEAVQVKQALQIIEHDRWFITPKLSRALRSREWQAAYRDAEADPVQTDSNGSAKVALISIERSEAAWRLLARWMDGSPSAALLADSLAQLRADVEAEFPDARRFMRPGFDAAPA